MVLIIHCLVKWRRPEVYGTIDDSCPREMEGTRETEGPRVAEEDGPLQNGDSRDVRDERGVHPGDPSISCATEGECGEDGGGGESGSSGPYSSDGSSERPPESQGGSIGWTTSVGGESVAAGEIPDREKVVASQTVHRADSSGAVCVSAQRGHLQDEAEESSGELEEESATSGRGDTTPTAPLEAVAPQEDTTTAPPQEDTVAVPPQEDTAAVPPQEDTAAVPLQEDTAAVPPQEDTATVPPQEESTTVPPQEESTTVLPQEDTATVHPQEESTTVPPQEESTTVPPQEESTTVPPQEESTTVPPQEDTAAVPLQEDTAAVPLQEDTAAVPPQEDTVTVPPQEDTATVPHQEDTAAVPPQEDTAAVPLQEDSTSTPQSVGGGNHHSPSAVAGECTSALTAQTATLQYLLPFLYPSPPFHHSPMKTCLKEPPLLSTTSAPRPSSLLRPQGRRRGTHRRRKPLT